MTTGKLCSASPRHLCPEAYEAVRSHDLRWDGNDWVLMSAPRRHTTGLAKWRECGADGEPYVWADCPFCGGELPLPEEGEESD